MNKYIPADKLIAKIKELNLVTKTYEEQVAFNNALAMVVEIITALQLERPDVQNGKFVFPKYLYARTKDNKTIDMSYAPQDMTAIEYVRNDFVQQEQPEADYKALLYSLLEAIDYSFVRPDGTYPVSLTYPVIDKVQYIKGQLSNEHEKEKERRTEHE